MNKQYQDDEDFLDLCDASSPLPDPHLVEQTSSLLPDPHLVEQTSDRTDTDNRSDSLEDYSDVETEVDAEDSKQHFRTQGINSQATESLTQSVLISGNETLHKSPVKRRSLPVDNSDYEISLTKKGKFEERFDIYKNSCKKDRPLNFSHRKEKLDETDCSVASAIQETESNFNTKSNFVNAAIKLKELFPDRTASNVGDLIKSVNPENKSESNIIHRVVELICSGNDNLIDTETDGKKNQNKESSSGDIQIALANPKLEVSARHEYSCTVVSKAKNRLSNKAKGKGIMKKVAIHTEETDSQMDVDDYVDPDDVVDQTLVPSPVTRPEIIVKTKMNIVKLRWTLIDSPKFSKSDINLRYVIEIQAPPCKEWKTLGRNIAGTVYEVSNLKPKQDYQFRVRATTRFGEISEPSPVAALCRSIGSHGATNDQQGDGAGEETFDTPESLNMEDFPWYHGYMTREEAECRLSGARDGQYLVRKNDIGTLCLSVQFCSSVKHYKITEDADEQVYISHIAKFKSLPELVAHYSIQGNGLVTQLKEFLPKDGTPSTGDDLGDGGGEVSSTTLICEGCGVMVTCDKIVQCCDGHLNCSSCVERVVKKVLSIDSEEINISCCYGEDDKCASYVPESQAKKVLPSLIFELLADKLNKVATEAIAKMNDVFSCPLCTNKFVVEGNMQELHCPHCKTATCRYCRKKWDSKNHSDCTINKIIVNSNEMETSTDWCSVPEGYQDFAAEVVPVNSEEFQNVISMFGGKLKRRGCRETVRKIYRIHNPRLLQKYTLMKNHMIEDIGKDSLNEHHLFHGTATSAVGGICRDGLDWRMCGVNGTAYGQGTYFAKNSEYSIRYCHQGNRLSSRHNVGNNLLLNLGLNVNQQGPFTFGVSRVNTSTNQQGPFVFGGGQTNIPSNTNQQGPFVFGGGQTNSNTNQQGPFVFGGGQTNSNTNQQGPFVFGTGQTSIPSNTNQQGFTNNKPMFGVKAVNTFTNRSGNTSLNLGSIIPKNPKYLSSNWTSGGVSTASLYSTSSNNPGSSMLSGKRKRKDDLSTDQQIPLEELFIDNEMGYMFLARVLVGRPCQGQHGLRKPPRDNNNRPYNSACDRTDNPSIFVIFDSAQCYPEYLIEFEFTGRL